MSLDVVVSWVVVGEGPRVSVEMFAPSAKLLGILLKFLGSDESSNDPGRDVGRRKKTGSRRRIVLKEDLVAEERRKEVRDDEAG